MAEAVRVDGAAGLLCSCRWKAPSRQRANHSSRRLAAFAGSSASSLPRGHDRQASRCPLACLAGSISSMCRMTGWSGPSMAPRAIMGQMA